MMEMSSLTDAAAPLSDEPDRISMQANPSHMSTPRTGAAAASEAAASEAHTQAEVPSAPVSRKSASLYARKPKQGLGAAQTGFGPDPFESFRNEAALPNPEADPSAILGSRFCGRN